MVDSDEVEFVTIDVGCGVGSVMWAGHKIEEWLLSCDVDSERGVKVKMVYCCFEIDPDALSVLQKWFATRITNGQVKLCVNPFVSRINNAITTITSSVKFRDLGFRRKLHMPIGPMTTTDTTTIKTSTPIKGERMQHC